MFWLFWMIVENKSETLWPNIFLDILLFIFCVVCVISWWQIDRFSELQLNIIKLQGFISIRSMINCPPAATPARVGFKIIQNSSRLSVESMLWVFSRMNRYAFCLKTFNLQIGMSYCQKKVWQDLSILSICLCIQDSFKSLSRDL